MHAVGVRIAAAPSPRLRQIVRMEHCRPTWAAGRAAARHWKLDRRGLFGRYLFTQRDDAEAFSADPEAADAAIGWLLRAARGGEPRRCPVEQVPTDAIAKPIFIVSAPRSGSTMLFDALVESDELWSIGGEGNGVIEGVPALHPAASGYTSHRLTATHATANAARTLRCGLIAELRDQRGVRYLDRSPSDRPARVRLVEKTPENALRVAFLAAVFPDATFVHLIRDARGAVSSIAAAWRHEGFVNIPELPGWERGAWHLLLPLGWERCRGRTLAEIAAFQWAAAHEAILDDLGALPAARARVVRYEALVDDPGTALHELCEALELSFAGALARRAGRPLPLSPTTVTPPSRAKWRFNPDFSEAALVPVYPLMRRLDELRSPPMPQTARRHRTVRLTPRVRFSCFLDDCDDAGEPSESQLVRDPSLRLQTGVTIPLELMRRTRFKERFLPGYPVAWVEDHATAVLRPFWLHGDELDALRCGAHSWGGLQVPLWRAGLLAEPGAVERRARLGGQWSAEAAGGFARSGYCSLGQPLGSAHVRALRRYYRALIDAGALQLGDDQVEGRYGGYNEHVARYFQHQLTSWVSRAAGQEVRPSYAYVSAYQGGAVLERHVDREQCEFTVSLLIDQTPAGIGDGWPLFLETASGTVRLVQAIGEAVLFRGTRIPHYREPLAAGRTSTCLLFHYVPIDFGRILY